MTDRILIGLTIMAIGSTIANILVHWFLVCPALYKEGARAPTGLLPWRMPRELSRYRELLRSRSDSLSPYYIILLSRWFNLLLVVVVGFLWLSSFQNPAP